MNFWKLYVISGAINACQKCGRIFGLPQIPCELGNPPATIVKHKCECGQEWEISECRGNPLAAMDLVTKGKSIQIGNPDYFSGWMIRAL